MTRETAAAKGRRYLTEGRVLLTEVNSGRVRALVRGGGALYPAGCDAGRWWCGCPARTDRCAHLEALRLVCVASTPTGALADRRAGGRQR